MIYPNIPDARELLMEEEGVGRLGKDVEAPMHRAPFHGV